jgi:hypothetical protein
MNNNNNTNEERKKRKERKVGKERGQPRAASSCFL